MMTRRARMMFGTPGCTPIDSCCAGGAFIGAGWLAPVPLKSPGLRNTMMAIAPFSKARREITARSSDVGHRRPDGAVGGDQVPAGLGRVLGVETGVAQIGAVAVHLRV